MSSTNTLGTIIPHATSNITLTGISATGHVNIVEENVDEALLSVSATGQVNTVTVHVIEYASAVPATASLGTITTTAVVFNFDAVKELYSRRRTILIDRAA